MSTINMEKHILAGKRIVIAGAGLSGLAFAGAIQKNWPQEHARPQIVMYERSSESLDRSRDGYTMGIRSDSGLAALKSLGLLDVALKSSTTGTDAQSTPTFWTKDFRQMLSFSPPATSDDSVPGHGIRLVRYVLRQILLDALPRETEVRWKCGCESVTVLDGGRVRVSLSDGSADECDLLVASDGANSKIRQTLLPHDGLDFAGAVCFIGTSRFPSGKPEILQRSWGMSISGQGVPFLTFPVDRNTGVWALSYRSDKPRERVKGEEAVERKDEILDEVRRRGRMFREPFGQFIDATDPVTLQIFSAMHKSPIQHSRELSTANVIFIGDANHAMSPFSGNGANMALMDSIELAKQLINCTNLRTAIENFDAESSPRSKAAVDRSYWTIRALHSQGITFWFLRGFLALIGVVLRLKR